MGSGTCSAQWPCVHSWVISSRSCHYTQGKASASAPSLPPPAQVKKTIAKKPKAAKAAPKKAAAKKPAAKKAPKAKAPKA